MSKTKKDTEVTGDILVIWRGYADKERARVAEGSLVVSSPGYKLEGLVMLAGATLVNAALYKAHEDAGSRGLVERVDEIVTFADVCEPLAKMPLRELLDVIGLTRDGRVLRAWHAAELAKPQARREVLDALAIRLKSYADFGPPIVPSIAALPRTRREKPVPQVEASP